MLNSCIRDRGFFQSTRDCNAPIRASDIDFAFNDIVKYLNTQIVPLINSLDGGVIPGVEGYENCFLQNVGNGTTRWTKIKASDIQDRTITLSKLVNITAGSIITAGNDRIFRAIEPLQNNQVFTNNTWQRAGADNFIDHSIGGDKIAYNVIGVGHLAAGVIGNPLGNNAVFEQHFTDGSIGDARTYTTSCITLAKIDPNLVIARNNALTQKITQNPILGVVTVPARCFVAANITQSKLVNQNTQNLGRNIITPFVAATTIGTFANGAITSNEVFITKMGFKCSGDAYNNQLKKFFAPKAIKMRHLASGSFSLASLFFKLRRNDNLGSLGRKIDTQKFSVAFRKKIGLA